MISEHADKAIMDAFMRETRRPMNSTPIGEPITYVATISGFNDDILCDFSVITIYVGVSLSRAEDAVERELAKHSKDWLYNIARWQNGRLLG